MANLKEKDIVNHIVSNFDKYFPDIKFWRTEFSMRDFRVDIVANNLVDLKDLNIREESYICNTPVFFEVKYNSNMRDLLFELQKQINFRDWYINYGKCFCMICVISDEFDHHMVRFMEQHNIPMFKINMKDEDLDTLTLSEYSLNAFELEDVKDICLEA